MKQILNHSDKIYFGSGAMLMLKYPLLARHWEKLTKQIEEENAAEGVELDEDEIPLLANEKLLSEGLTNDFDALVCEDYTEEEIKRDEDAVDWEKAFEVVEKMEEQKRQAQLKKI